MTVITARAVLRIDTRATTRADVRLGRPNLDSAIGMATPQVQRLAAKMFRRTADREDAVQQALLAITKKIQKYDPDRGNDFLGWSFRVSENAMKDMRRRNARVRARAELGETDKGEQKRTTVHDRDGDHLLRLRATLSEEDAELWDMLAARTSRVEIAERLRITTNALYVRINRFRGRLKQIETVM